MLDTTLPIPTHGRAFTASRSVRLSGMNDCGRLRLDAVARFLQDVAIDDVSETGWGMPEHLWFVRSMRIDVLAPIVGWGDVSLTTWCSGVAAIAAGRRWSVSGRAGGRIEVDSVWIHLDADMRPARIGDFGVYGEAAGDRLSTTKLALPDPPTDAQRVAWPLRSSDIDLHGHVNNAVYWQAVEEVLALDGPLRAELDYRQPIDLGDELELLVADGTIGFDVGGDLRAVARISSI